MAPRWALRPSNLLIALAAALYLYQVLQIHDYSLRHSYATPIIVLSVVLRYWENDALKSVEVDESDMDEARDTLQKAGLLKEEKKPD